MSIDSPVQTTTQDQAEWFAEKFALLARNIQSYIKGKEEVVGRALVCMLAEGHLLIEDVPGVGKTSLAKAMAQSITGEMRRIQFTPDLLPSDVIGVTVYNSQKREFEFHPGAVFANVVLADEINRASPKTQSALLEVMAERQVTVDGDPYLVPSPFITLATQNPVEQGGTYPLPEAQLDRFMMCLAIGYPDHASEVAIVRGTMPIEDVAPVLSTEEMRRMIDVASRVYVADSVTRYLVTITASTRVDDRLRLGVSPRGSQHLSRACQANAVSRGRSFVTADDVKEMVPLVLGHRMIMRPEAELAGETAESLLHTIMAVIPTPDARTPD